MRRSGLGRFDGSREREGGGRQKMGYISFWEKKEDGRRVISLLRPSLKGCISDRLSPLLLPLFFFFPSSSRERRLCFGFSAPRRRRALIACLPACLTLPQSAAPLLPCIKQMFGRLTGSPYRLIDRSLCHQCWIKSGRGTERARIGIFKYGKERKEEMDS
jgi:hypothetical protein